MVRYGLAYSLIIKGSIAFWDKDMVTYRPLKPNLQAGCALAWCRLPPLSRTAERFVEFARERLDQR